MFLSINFKYFLYSLTNLLSHNNSNQFSTLWNIKILLIAIQYYFKLKVQYFTTNIFSFYNLFIIICLQPIQKKLLKNDTKLILFSRTSILFLNSL